MPFAKAVMIYGDPYTVPKDATDEQIEETRLKLQQDLITLQDEAERMFGYPA